MESLCLRHFQHYLCCFSMLCVDGDVKRTSIPKHLCICKGLWPFLEWEKTTYFAAAIIPQ